MLWHSLVVRIGAGGGVCYPFFKSHSISIWQNNETKPANFGGLNLNISPAFLRGTPVELEPFGVDQEAFFLRSAEQNTKGPEGESSKMIPM